jgi:hypothetical protein
VRFGKSRPGHQCLDVLEDLFVSDQQGMSANQPEQGIERFFVLVSGDN